MSNSVIVKTIKKLINFVYIYIEVTRYCSQFFTYNRKMKLKLAYFKGLNYAYFFCYTDLNH